jgi:two-component system cell cycle sensor histidine kinase/response regulator CckA
MRETGGVLEVTLEARDLSPEAAAANPDLKPGAWLVLTVSDTGPGMGPEIVERIFDPYFTTKEVGEGSGMGLSVVHGIVREHGGAVLVRSEPGKGSCFEVFIPRVEEEAVEGEETAGALPLGTERVLLVDDDPALAELGRQMFMHLQYEVTVETDSMKALERFREGPDRFDLVLTDMTMPHLTGADLAREFLRIRPDIPVILCTGYSEIITGDKAAKMGIRAFVTKPLGLRELAETVRRVLDGV